MAILESKRNQTRAGALFEFTQGIEVDARLAKQEVRVQIAWARALAGLKILTQEEFKQVESTLSEALTLMEAGKFQWRVEDEDIHMNLERFVTERAGILGKKMHVGRSRNDLIATTLRLFARDTVEELSAEVKDLILALCERAEKDADVIVPGLTHLQHGQPIRHGHTLAGHGWAFSRDLKRLRAAQNEAMGVMPQGSAALSGTTLPVDLNIVARELGFGSPPVNSYDSVGDRDFILEALNALAISAVHLSRLAEDCVIWSSTAVGLVRLPSAWSTGSSIMPNKRNPDVPELVRAKAAHIIAASTNAQTLMKGVPTSYGSDLHELKSVFMRAVDEFAACLSVLPEFVRGLEPNRVRARELLKKGHILATEIADQLTAQGVPFREAYAQVAALVETAENQGVQLEDLSESDWSPIVPGLSAKFMPELTPEYAVERRTNCGGSSMARTLEGILALRKILG